MGILDFLFGTRRKEEPADARIARELQKELGLIYLAHQSEIGSCLQRLEQLQKDLDAWPARLQRIKGDVPGVRKAVEAIAREMRALVAKHEHSIGSALIGTRKQIEEVEQWQMLDVNNAKSNMLYYLRETERYLVNLQDILVRQENTVTVFATQYGNGVYLDPAKAAAERWPEQVRTLTAGPVRSAESFLKKEREYLREDWAKHFRNKQVALTPAELAAYQLA